MLRRKLLYNWVVDEEKVKKEPKLNFRATWREVTRKQKPLMLAMFALLALSVLLLIFTLFMLRPQNTVVIVGYGDVYGEIAGLSGGYRRDSWMNMLAFPLLAVVFGVVHNFLALRIYQKHGRDLALTFIGMTVLLVVATFVVLLRLTGEW